MAKITFKGAPVTTIGDLPKVGTPAPDFTLTKNDLSPIGKKDLAGKNVVLNIFPSIDTSVCATSVRTFNQKAAGMPNTVVLCVSKDLPFAMKRFCGAEGIEKVTTASWFRPATRSTPRTISSAHSLSSSWNSSSSRGARRDGRTGFW